MEYELFRILNKEHVETTLAGNLYMNTLNTFRAIEDNCVQGDPLEGVSGTIRSDQLRQLGLIEKKLLEEDSGAIFIRREHQEIVPTNDMNQNQRKELLSNAGEVVSLISDIYGLCNVYCMYKMPIDDSGRFLLKPDLKILGFAKDKTESMRVMRIRDTGAFLERIETAIEAGIKANVLEYGIYGSVCYGDIWSNADGPSTSSVFRKAKQFEYQREWRLCLLRKMRSNSPYTLRVGNLTDIAEIITLDQFILEGESTYPSPSVDLFTSDVYNMFGTLNTTAKLMGAYMPPSPVLRFSDAAQADWHYAQYLWLIGKEGEIESFLSKALFRSVDFDHVELLSEWFQSQGDYPGANSAYDYLAEHNANAITAQPERFFFAKHNLLMKSSDIDRAVTNYIEASESSGIPQAVLDSMEVDCLFGLGCYDQVVPICEKMKETGPAKNDPILDYNLGFCYLHLLDIKRSMQFFEKASGYYSDNEQYPEKLLKGRELATCFYTGTPLPQRELLEAPYPDFPFEAIREFLSGAFLRGKLLLSYDVLYFMLSEGIEAPQNIKYRVMVKDIVALMADYLRTGDCRIYTLIERLKHLRQLEIVSPSLVDYYFLIKEGIPPEEREDRLLEIVSARNVM